MKLAGRSASVILTDDGLAVLRIAEVTVPEMRALEVDIVESEDLGLWIRLYRDGREHFLLLRWDYILAIDIEEQTRKVVGLKAMS